MVLGVSQVMKNKTNLKYHNYKVQNIQPTNNNTNKLHKLLVVINQALDQIMDMV